MADFPQRHSARAVPPGLWCRSLLRAGCAVRGALQDCDDANLRAARECGTIVCPVVFVALDWTVFFAVGVCRTIFALVWNSNWLRAPLFCSRDLAGTINALIVMLSTEREVPIKHYVATRQNPASRALAAAHDDRCAARLGDAFPRRRQCALCGRPSGSKVPSPKIGKQSADPSSFWQGWYLALDNPRTRRL